LSVRVVLTRRSTRSAVRREFPDTRTPSRRSGIPAPVRLVVQLVKTARSARLDTSRR